VTPGRGTPFPIRGKRAAPERFTSARIEYRRPALSDVEPIFTRYAADPDVTRYLAWPRHVTLHDTRVFIDFSDGEWRTWGCGPYLMTSLLSGDLLGSTGISFDSPDVGSTGYVVARDAWGHGYATEALGAMRELGGALGLRRMYAVCHVDHKASARVMEKCGFRLEGVLRRHLTFPNLGSGWRDVLCYAVTFPGDV
jgi:ribosomal-protein-alanine N-acetyltransferase